MDADRPEKADMPPVEAVMYERPYPAPIDWELNQQLPVVHPIRWSEFIPDHDWYDTTDPINECFAWIVNAGRILDFEVELAKAKILWASKDPIEVLALVAGCNPTDITTIRQANSASRRDSTVALFQFFRVVESMYREKQLRGVKGHAIDRDTLLVVMDQQFTRETNPVKKFAMGQALWKMHGFESGIGHSGQSGADSIEDYLQVLRQGNGNG